MSAATAAREAKRQDGLILEYPVLASTTIYKGTLVVDKGTGYASPGTDGSGYVLLGVAYEDANNASGASGQKTVRVYKTGVFEFFKASAAQTDVGTRMVIHDDQTIGASSTNSVYCGYVTAPVGTTKVLVRIDLDVK